MRLKYLVASTSIFLGAFVGVSPVASAADMSHLTVVSSEAVNVENSVNLSKIYLQTFKPNETVFFKIALNNDYPLTILDGNSPLELPAQATFQFSLNSGSLLAKSAIGTPIKVYTDSNKIPLIQIFPTPADFPVITLKGDTTLVASKEIFSTPVVKDGTYAIASIGTGIKFFTKSPTNLIGFRRLTDAPVAPGFGGQGVYAYLEQKDLSVTATSPGTWRILDATFNTIQKIGKISTRYGNYFPEGHGMTVSPFGDPVVIITPTRTVDSSWLKRRYLLPVLDCDIAQIHNGKAIAEFSFWDWAVKNKTISAPLLDAMPLFNDPQNPKTSPIDICHANSLQYSAKDHVFLMSLRSPSVLMIVGEDLKSVKAVIPTGDALQHFARFVSSTEITALGNFTLGKVSKFLDFTLTGGKWILKETPFPVHVVYCGNTQKLDATHIWLGGGCGAYSPGVLGTIYSLKSGAMTELGSVAMENFTYSYRADLFKP
jgi:hypothetical protein